MSTFSPWMLDQASFVLGAPFRYPAVWLPTAFLLGASIGSLLNVCILRLPAGRSLLWPSSTCGACFQHILWRDNIPLVSYWLLRGRCRYCGTSFSSRYFWIELLTTLAFGGLWCAEVVFNIRAVGTVPSPAYTPTDYTSLALIWLYHVCLVSILIAIVGITMHGAPVPRGLYGIGTAIGLLGAVLAPWPWPVNALPWSATTPLTFLGRARGFFQEFVLIPAGLQPWPVVLVDARSDAASLHGLATALAGALLGFGLIRLPAKLDEEENVILPVMDPPAPPDRARENAFLLLMIGTYVGWQGVVLVLVAAGLLKVIVLFAALIWRAFGRLPFCLLLALGAVLVLLGSGQLAIVVSQLLAT